MHKHVLAIVLLFWSVNEGQSKKNDYENRSHDWDLLIFTQQWPETFCKDWVHENPSHTCVMPKRKDSWTIHGIWPTKIGTRGPEFCNRTWMLDPNEIRPIETDLMNVWTNIEGGTAVYTLWSHEWSKHGTCAAILEPFNSPLKYFSMGLQLSKQFGMSSILAQYGIVPDDNKEYNLIDIHNAIKTSLKVNPVVRCRVEDGKSYLSELRICFDKTLSLCDCDNHASNNVDSNDHLSSNNIASDTTNCDHSSGILYPHDWNPPKTMLLELYKLIDWIQWFTF